MLCYQLKNKVILHFGIGLIGSCIKEEFFKRKIKYQSFKVFWQKEEFAKSINSIFYFLQDIDFEELVIIWSAGRVGFGGLQKETNDELNVFKEFCDVTETFLSKHNTNSTFILLSSAGGLHENQIKITKNSKCEPKRPYGFLKWKQEELVKNMNTVNQKVIVRPSSVFSTTYHYGRLGLINVIIINALKFKFTTFYGSLTTLRDYISAEDISKYLVNKIESNSNFDLINYLVSAKPTSIFEIKQIVELKLNKQCYIKYLINKTNSGNITFHKNCLPIDFEPSDLKTNINKLIKNSSF